MDPIDLTLERLNRLEQRVGEVKTSVEEGFAGIHSALAKIVTVLEAHDQRLEAITSRVDKLLEQTMRVRTQEVARLADIERRLDALEQRRP